MRDTFAHTLVPTDSIYRQSKNALHGGDIRRPNQNSPIPLTSLPFALGETSLGQKNYKNF